MHSNEQSLYCIGVGSDIMNVVVEIVDEPRAPVEDLDIKTLFCDEAKNNDTSATPP